MPIFQDDLEHERLQRVGSFAVKGEPTGAKKSARTSPQARSPPIEIRGLRPRPSEESIRTDLCDGPLPDSPEPPTPEQRSRTAYGRAELIERLKRSQSPAWASTGREHIRDERQPYPYESLLCRSQLESILRPAQQVTSPRTPHSRSDSPTLLPSAQITPEKEATSEDERRLRDGLTIERPRSALHSGDFTQDEHKRGRHADGEPAARDHGRAQPSTPHSWATTPPRPQAPFFSQQIPAPTRTEEFKSVPSSLSSSLSSSFVYKPPTSPLVQSESNDDFDISLPMTGIDLGSHSPSPGPRNRPFYPSTSPTPFGYPSSRTPGHQRTPSFRREATFPYQAHQPRRSLTSTPSLNPQSLHAAPVTPAHLRPRRPSLTSDNSPLQHASMVGSYEESILRGRMSTTPSKPIEFLAQIGVLGLGKCKTSLRCPAHVTLPFPAVFYSYPSAAGPGGDGPSPYVGQIDLENGLANSEDETRAKRKVQSREKRREDAAEEGRKGERRPEAPRRRSSSPRAPPGGSYRIPQKGRIQIIIKNQNKTAVKLFLVPYDLAGMEPGTKTFIRQRSYSSGPIIDGPPRPAADPEVDRPMLRYLVHLHICSPSRGRFYLYRNVRVVFANRVPDGECKLRNETTWPEPTYAPYKAVRVMRPPQGQSRGGAMLAAEKAFRRRSAGWPGQAALEGFRAESVFARQGESARGAEEGMEGADLGRVWGSEERERYEKLSKGDVGYGGNAFFGGGGSPGEEGLLSRRLRGLGMPER